MEVSTQNLSFRYAASLPPALLNVTISAPSGACCAILGPTGAGKTTLLYALAGVLGAHYSTSSADGAILIGNDEFRPLPREILFPSVGMAVQESVVQVSGMRDSVYDEIKFTLENIGLQESLHEQRVASVIQSLGMQHLQSRQPITLSGGEMQRVALATLLVAQPSVMLLDEPTNSLDSESIQRLVRILRAMHGKTTVFFSDSQLEMAIMIADVILVLNQGEMTFFGNKELFFRHLSDFQHILPTNHWPDIARRLLNLGHHSRFARLMGL